MGGSVQPASPKENTIWVNTDAEITGWVFDAQQPDYLETGNVWFKTGQYGKMGLNAVKKNCIFIYPQSCQQWDGTSFTARDIQLYKDGQWTGFDDVIYAGGTWYYTSRTSLYNGGTVTEGTDIIVIKATSTNSSSAYVGVYVDLTGYSKLVMTGNKTVGSGNSKCGIFVTDGNTANQYAMWNGDSTVCHEISNTSGRQEIMLDISALSGSYYVWVGVYSAAVAGELQVTEFRME